MQPENMKSFATGIVTALGFLLAIVPAANAQHAFQCIDKTIINDGRTIDSNLIVQPNATCELDNVTVSGNVQVGTGAGLQAFPRTGQTVAINGNIVADECKFVQLETSGGGAISVAGNYIAQNCTNAGAYSGPRLTIGGNVVFSGNGTGPVAGDGVVRGNLTVDNNNTRDLPVPAVVDGNQVSGNVDVSDNFAPDQNPTLVKDNTIGGNLRCVGNSQLPDDGGTPNTVGGHKTGQCAGL